MEGEVKIQLSELDRLRNIENKYKELLDGSLLEKRVFWKTNTEVELIHKGSKALDRVQEEYEKDLILYKHNNLRLINEIEELKKRPKSCILF